MEAALSSLEEHSAALLLTKVIEYLTKHIGEVFVVEEEVIVIGFIVHPAKVESCAIHVARAFRSISIHLQ
jgi:hypothetical protein